jgi:hypothetical protein
VSAIKVFEVSSIRNTNAKGVTLADQDRAFIAEVLLSRLPSAS